jgi:hypothetical protein
MAKSASFDITSTSRLVMLTTAEEGYCGECADDIAKRALPHGPGYLVAAINHHVEVHGRKLLHVGTETISGPDGKPWHTTAAYLADPA